MSRSSSGQATAEYVGVLALLAAVVAATLGFGVAGAPGIVNAVVGQVRHALCLVMGAECRQPEPRACVMRTDRRRDGWAVSVAVIRLDHEYVVVRETLSDGTVRLTRLRHVGLGGAISAPTSAQLEVGSVELGVGAEASVQLLALLGRGRVWHATSAKEADRIVAALAGAGAAPEPHEVVLEGGVSARAQLDAVLGIGGSTGGRSGGGPPAPEQDGSVAGEADGREQTGGKGGRVGVLPEAGAAMRADLLLGRREHRRTGETTYVLRLDGQAEAVLEAANAGARGTSEPSGIAELRVDRRGQPVELVVTGSTHLTGRAEAPALEQVGLGGLRGARRWEASARLDLRDPEARRAFARWWADPLDGRAVGDLAATVADRAHLETRVFARTGQEGRRGLTGRFVVEVGGELRDEVQGERLIGASDRPPSGIWEPRLDCLRAA